MQKGPSSCMGNRHLKPAETKLTYEGLNHLYGRNMSQKLSAGDVHENEVTKGNEKHSSKSNLGTPDIKNLDTY